MFRLRIRIHQSDCVNSMRSTGCDDRGDDPVARCPIQSYQSTCDVPFPATRSAMQEARKVKKLHKEEEEE